jgi:hypothetical protein
MDMTDSIDWYQFNPAPGCKYEAPAWALHVGLCSDGRLFVPAAVLGNERYVVLAALFDGDVDVVISDDGHGYLPSEWVELQDSTLKSSFENVRAKIRRTLN